MIRESYIEKKCTKFAKEKGWDGFKLKIPNHRGANDRFYVNDGKIIFVEYKIPGQKPKPLQRRFHEKLKKQKMKTFVIDNIEDGKKLFL